MSLVAGRGPLSRDAVGTFTPPLPAGPGGVVYVEPHPRRIRAVIHGRTVLDTEAALMVHRYGQALSYAFPAAAVGDLAHTAVAEAPGYVHVRWDSVDTWFEEGRELVHYPPNPYHRIDCRPTERALRVSVGGRVLVDTSDTTIVFETALAPRLYVRPEAVRTDWLRRTETTSYCNYKGWATYWAAVTGDAGAEDASTHETTIEDVAWSYEDPPPECLPIKGFLSFDDERADVVAALPRP